MDIRHMLRVYRIVNDPKKADGGVKVGYKLAGAFLALALFAAIGAATMFLSSDGPATSASFAGADGGGDGGSDPSSSAEDAAGDATGNLTDEPGPTLPIP